MKNIKRFKHESRCFKKNNPYVIVKIDDIDILEAQNHEMLEALMAMYGDWKYIDNFADSVKELIEKVSGQSWEDIKEMKND